MPALVEIFEMVDGAPVRRSMYPIDAAHAVRVEPERWCYKPRPVFPVANDELIAGVEPVTDLPALPRGPGRPRKDGGAA